jgi:hypothetical protein
VPGYDPVVEWTRVGRPPRAPAEEDGVRPTAGGGIRRWASIAALAGVLSLLGGYGRAAGAPGAEPGAFTAGARGGDDPYFPLDGNGGYDVAHYGLDVRYDPATRRLAGVATITARALQNLSRFDLDFVGLTVRSIDVGGRPATWTRTRGELAVTPAAGLPLDEDFTAVVRYDGVPTPVHEPTRADDATGFLHSPDGALFAGEPHVASRWFPVNDTLADKAAYTFRVTVPAGRTALANGVLTGSATAGRWTTWTWDAAEPMAPYLAGLTIGTFDLRAYTRRGIRYWDAVDASLVRRVQPRTGSRYAISGAPATGYERLSRRIRVPAAGARLSFWVDRPPSRGGDAFLVEVHTAGRGDWTTLPDRNGHTTGRPRDDCGYLAEEHPFLRHYLTPRVSGGCAARGTAARPGRWWAGVARGGLEHWSVDLAGYAGRTVEVALTYATAGEPPRRGVFVDDVVVSGAGGAGTTSFEKDGDTRDGWRSAPAPAGSPRRGAWIVGRAADGPPTLGERALSVLAEGPRVLDFLAGRFGAYPLTSAGGIVHAFPFAGALENQTRPTYSADFFAARATGTVVVVHELAHQWFGGSVTPATWRDIWLNEGFATYAEWLWSEAHGGPSAQRLFKEAYRGPENPFWSVPIGDPGRDRIFDFAVYQRGAMTLHRLRHLLGDADFFTLLRRWAQENAGRNVETADFVHLAEDVADRDLGAFFTAWLYTAARPSLG